MHATSSHVTRRQFLKTTSGAIAGTMLAPAFLRAETQPAPAKKLIGIQAGAISFVDEGTEKVLDIFQEKGAVNAIFLATFTYGRGIGGRQIPNQPLPDHGKQEYDVKFHGGNFATPHPKFYKSTSLKQTKAPGHGDLDILA